MLQCRVVNVGGRELDNFKKLGDKLKVVLCSIKKLPIRIQLIWDISDLYVSKYTQTNLWKPLYEFFQCNNSIPCSPKDTKHLQP